jgi:hypothetical protein
MTYTELNIQQRINAKGNAGVMWGDSAKNVLRMRDVQYWNFQMYDPQSLKLERPGIHNNRNYDGPGDNYYQQ